MTFLFYPQTAPHDVIFFQMTFEIPAGSFYNKAVENVPRTDSTWAFVLETTTIAPVYLSVGGKLVTTVMPQGGRQTVVLPLATAPLVFNLKAENGIDLPVHLTVVQSYLATILYSLAREHYDVAGRLVEQYSDAIRSPWGSFFAEWLLPWRRELPPVQTLRVLAVKAAALTLYCQSTQQGGVVDLASSFCLTTPVLERQQNPETWQPDLYQPYTSGQDISGFNFHCWAPNLCQARWGAFLKYCENAPQYQLFRCSEQVVMIKETGVEQYSQQLFTPEDFTCSPLGLLTAIGCMDAITMVGSMQLTANPAFCAWNEPMDMGVWLPGIGGYFFDSSVLFDGPWGPFDSVYDVDQLTDYWVGASTKKAFDFGCLGEYPGKISLPENKGCCTGPDAKLFSTIKTDASVTWAAGPLLPPVHPLFGGGDAGALLNPYFALL
jgi:hypothetical protein